MAGFDDLAALEEARRRAFGQYSQQQILDLGKQYSSEAAKRRAALSQSLMNTGQQTFDLQNPKILEDLNSRGLFTSPSTVANSQAQALKEIALANGTQLNNFDDQTFNEMNSIRNLGLSANLQGEQDALDSGLDLRRGGLESQLQGANASREEQLARDLADQQRRAGITNSLIGVGGSLLPSLFTKGGSGGGLFSALGGGGAKAAGTGYSSMAGRGVGFPIGNGMTAGGGGIGLGGAAGIGAAGIGSMLLAKSVENKAKKSLGTTLGNVAGTIANPIGSQLNKAKDVVKNVFCFEAGTPVTMADNSQRPISQLYVGANTKGGEVVSIRTSRTGAGTRYLYKGIEVTGSHAVKENGKWIRVKDSDHSAPQNGEGIVWSIVTTDHRIWINGIEMADETETDLYETLTIDESLAHLNKEEKNILVEA